jgi:steroid 5-alpha reductase family enzyme
MGDILLVSALVVVVAVLSMAASAVVARRIGRVNVVDVTWGLALTVVAVVCAVVGPVVSDAPAWRAWLLVVMVAVWGGRLSWHIHRRSRGHGEDPRYTAMLGGKGINDEGALADALGKVFVMQGAAIWLVSLPLQAGALVEVRTPWLVWAGVVVWLVGVVFESVGDAQLAAYRAMPRDQRPEVLDTGLWRYSRHPNYFGDACVWWGIWLSGALASSGWAAIATFVAPFAMTYFLAFATGARLLEQTMMRRPGYPAYAAKTSMFVPWPPRR